MTSIDREDIQMISRHSNLPEAVIGKLFTDYVHNDKSSWSRFLRLLFLGLGVGFFAAGIIMFFAYNWNSIHKFAKLGIIEFLIICTVGLTLLKRFNLLIRNILLTGASVLVGVLFAVFGQIYQTGADAYDFFLGWTIGVTIWVIVSGFPVLWLLYVILINITFITYMEQVADHTSGIQIYTCIFIINLAAVLISTFIAIRKDKTGIDVPDWYLNTLGVFAVLAATYGMVAGIFDYGGGWLILLTTLTVTSYAAALYYGFINQRIFYLSIIPLSLITIISALLLKASDGGGLFLVVFFFIGGSITLVVRTLIQLQKKMAPCKTIITCRLSWTRSGTLPAKILLPMRPP